MSRTWDMPDGSGDRWPEDYERGRPGWPTESVRLPRLPSAATVLDLGAGTGKLTRLLVAEFDRVLAVEPADPMRRLLAALCPDAEALAGSGQEIPLANGSVDAVFAAQAFHWFDDERAVAEIARVLRPGGALVLLWNLPAGPWDPSTERAEEPLNERMPGELDHIPLDLGGPRAESGWRPSVGDSPFGPFEAAVLPNPQTVDRDGLVAFYASMGWLADLPDRERLPLLDDVRSRLTAPEYRRPWETHGHWAGAARLTAPRPGPRTRPAAADVRSMMAMRVPTLGVVGGLVLLLAAGANAAAPPVFRRTGIVVRAPAGWFVTGERLNGITDPVQRFVLSSYRVPVDADAGNGYVPPSRAVLAQLVEEVPPLYGSRRAWPPRPTRFALPRLGRMETLDGDRWGEVLFREHGRHFILFVWVGRRATSTQARLLLRALDGIRIAPS